MASIQGIYVALFGRPADPRGLEYFNEVTNNGQDLTAINDLAGEDEYLDRFTGFSNEEIVNSIYQSLFERDGEPEGIAYFVGELEAGRLNINNIAIAILDGAQGDDLDMVNAKIAAANLFTASLDSEIEIDAYTDPADGRNFLDDVTPENLPTQEEIDAFILAEVVEQAGGPGGGGGGDGSGGGSLPTLEERAQEIAADWQALDAVYNDTPAVNEAFVLLGNRYVDYLNDGGSPIEVIAKTGPDRAQTMHDNLLSNLTEYAVRQRTSANDQDPNKGYPEDIRSDAAKEFGLRPQNQGFTNDAGNHDALASAAWDLEHYPEWGVVDPGAVFDEGKVYVVNWSEFEASAQTQTTPTVDVYNSFQDAEEAISDGDSVVFGDLGVFERLYHQGAVDLQAENVTLLGVPGAKFAGEIKGEGLDASRLEFITGYLPEYVEPSIAVDNRFEPGSSGKLDALIQDLVADSRISADDYSLLSRVTTPEDAIKLLWDYVDDNYSYYDESINSVGIDLGIIYAKHLLAGGTPLDDVIVKYSPGTPPAREQSMHDNLLGNFDENSIVDKFGRSANSPDLYSPTEILDRIEDAGLAEVFGARGVYTDGRPIYGGYLNQNPQPTVDWDNDFFNWV